MWKKAFGIFVLLGVCVLANPFQDSSATTQGAEEPPPAAGRIGNQVDGRPQGLIMERTDGRRQGEITADVAGTSPAPAVSGRKRSGLETWYHFYGKGRPVSDIIALVFFLGMLFGFEEMRKIFFDTFRSRHLRSMNLQDSTLDDIMTEVNRVPNTGLAKLIGSMLTLHSSTGSLESIQDEIDLFIRNQQERFNSFRSRLDFLSDSAGALGLLGTVWGIFNAFESKDWRPENILPSIGFALVTTFIGIIASLILNLLSTEVFSYFNRKIEILQLKIDEFRKNLYRHHSEMHYNNGKNHQPDIDKIQGVG